MAEAALVPATPQSLVDAKSATEMVEQAGQMAKKLATIIEDQKLTTEISGKKHVRCEGWTTLGAMMGVFPYIEWTRPMEGGGWEARCIVKRPDGAVLGAAEAHCGGDEALWAARDSFAQRSMAQTRATSKAMRVVFSWVMTLAGYEATPAEEMTDGATRTRRPRQATPEPPEPIAEYDEPPPDYEPQEEAPPVESEDRATDAQAGAIARLIIELHRDEQGKTDSAALKDWLRQNIPGALTDAGGWNKGRIQGRLTKARASEIIKGLQELV